MPNNFKPVPSPEKQLKALHRMAKIVDKLGPDSMVAKTLGDVLNIARKNVIGISSSFPMQENKWLCEQNDEKDKEISKLLKANHSLHEALKDKRESFCNLYEVEGKERIQLRETKTKLYNMRDEIETLLASIDETRSGENQK